MAGDRNSVAEWWVPTGHGQEEEKRGVCSDWFVTRMRRGAKDLLMYLYTGI